MRQAQGPTRVDRAYGPKRFSQEIDGSMCGITGFVEFKPSGSAPSPRDQLKTMTSSLAHRGPDDAGYWVDETQGVALGHRRLSVIDLSAAGHQPMVSANDRYVLAYNGEVYNFPEMRSSLIHQGAQFRGNSDTEVILEAISSWGIDATLGQMIGMFAFALWDRQRRELVLVRDRLGIKPLYWGRSGGSVFFGSELKALLGYQGWRPEIDRDTVSSFLRHNYVPAPESIYRDVFKLEPGCYAVFRRDAPPDITRYWDFRAIASSHVADRPAFDDNTAVAQLEDLLRDAVGRRMVADVPLGALLSGGIDSSLVASLMQDQSPRPIKTFTIGFDNPGYNEAPYASDIARHLGTDHTELYVQPEDALKVIPELPKYFDEPFSDSSQIPTLLVCELTRRHVTVALSGDGGDELFAGYNRYLLASRLWKRLSMAPGPVRTAIGASVRLLPERSWDALARIVPAGRRPSQFGHKVHKLGDSLRSAGPDSIYRALVSHWKDPDAIVIDATEAKGELWNDQNERLIPNFMERMQFLDTLTYLPDDILTKVDRASMAVSLEARVPLLDHRVVELAWQLPLRTKVREGKTKWILRQVLSKYVPPRLFERPKMGFGVPLDSWLRGPLRHWAEELLNERRIRDQGILRPEPIRQKWSAHLQGENWSYALWDILMFQAWFDRYHP